MECWISSPQPNLTRGDRTFDCFSSHRSRIDITAAYPFHTGKLDKLIAKAEADIEANRVRDLDEVFHSTVKKRACQEIAFR
uniref:Uncharacterized protein n=1 Tax=Oscillatoriales cyanobacterium SpSt-402 TaxID=2282168 RepID=A0A832M5M3_9CYAN